MAALEAQVRQDLRAAEERQERERIEGEALDVVLAQAAIEYPDVMASEEIRHELLHLAENVEQQGFKFDRWLEQNHLKLDAVAANMRPTVDARLRRQLVLMNLAEREGFSVEREEIDAAIEEEVARYKDDSKAQARQSLTSENARLNIGVRLLQGKALDKLVSIARGEGVLLPGDDASDVKPNQRLAISD